MGTESSAVPNAESFPAKEQEGRVPLLEQGDGVERRGMGLLPLLHSVVIGTLFTLGISSAIVGILAEYFNYEEKSRNVIHDSTWCASYPSDRIILLCSLGIGFVLAAEVLATVAGYCVSCSNGETERTNPLEAQARKILVASWVFGLFAMYKFHAGNLAKDTNKSGSRPGYCVVVSDVAFVEASLSAFVSVLLGLRFYLGKCSAKDAANGAIPDADV